MRAGLVVAGIIAATLADCREPTEIRLDLASASCAEVRDTRIFVAPSSAEAAASTTPSATTKGCIDGASGAIGSIVLYPSSARDAQVAIRVLTGLGDDCASPTTPGGSNPKACVEARRVLHYIPHTPLTLPIGIDESCKAVECDDPSKTCYLGQCVDAVIDPASCQSGPCLPSLDGGVLGPGADASISDAIVSDVTASDVGASDATVLDASTLDALPVDGGCSTLDPGNVTCGNLTNVQTCPSTQVCCPLELSCVPLSGNCSATPVESYAQCNEPADCPGQSCCWETAGQSSDILLCKSGGCAANSKVCVSSCDCPTGTACVQCLTFGLQFGLCLDGAGSCPP
jgi:hypothetical protein